MQMNSGQGIQKVRDLAASGKMGTVTLIQTHHFRNRPYGGWLAMIPPDCNPEHVDWAAFQGEAKVVPFDPQRYINWRFYWDYSGGDVFENMVHTLGILVRRPRSVDPADGHDDWRQLPLAANGFAGYVPGLDEPCRETFLHVHLNLRQQLLRRKTRLPLRYQGDADSHRLRRGSSASAREEGRAAPAPEHGGDSELTSLHMQNFFDCVRSRKEPVCPLELGFRTSIACQMAVASYRRQSTVRWDPATEEIV